MEKKRFEKYWMPVFAEADGSFSWRKGLTAVAAFNFTLAVQAHLWFKVEELPATYTAILAGVFVFYFGKALFDKIGIVPTANQEAK